MTSQVETKSQTQNLSHMLENEAPKESSLTAPAASVLVGANVSSPLAVSLRLQSAALTQLHVRLPGEPKPLMQLVKPLLISENIPLSAWMM